MARLVQVRTHRCCHGAPQSDHACRCCRAREITGGRRNCLFAYDVYLAILSEGTEPL
jgi:hypothetical protein